MIIVAVKDTHTTKTHIVVQFVVEVVIRKRKFPSVNVLIAKALEIQNKIFLLGLLGRDAQDAMVKGLSIKQKKHTAIIVYVDM